MLLKKLIFDLAKYKDANRAKNQALFFKTKKGGYGEGDKFLGIAVPDQRKAAKKYFQDITLKEIGALLKSGFHEYRLTALIILKGKYKKADEKTRKKIYEFYVKHLPGINNWDLVDVSCPNIVGEYLSGKDKSFLYNLARSKNLWRRRVAIVSTLCFINKNDFRDALKIAELFLTDKHDLIHKATGWMLREVGKKNLRTEEEFLDKYAAVMPRVMLRYAIERFAENKRKFYLNRKREQ